MRPLVHPNLDDITVEGIMHALSDPVRVAIYADLAGTGGTQNCSNYLTVSDKDIPKSTLSQHFKALREAGLIRAERHGVEMHNTSRCGEIEQRFPGLVAAIVNAHKVQLAGKSAGKKKSVKRKAGSGRTSTK